MKLATSQNNGSFRSTVPVVIFVFVFVFHTGMGSVGKWSVMASSPPGVTGVPHTRWASSLQWPHNNIGPGETSFKTRKAEQSSSCEGDKTGGDRFENSRSLPIDYSSLPSSSSSACSSFPQGNDSRLTVGTLNPDVVVDAVTGAFEQRFGVVRRRSPVQKFATLTAASVKRRRRHRRRSTQEKEVPPTLLPPSAELQQPDNAMEKVKEEEEDRSDHKHYASKACVPHHIWETFQGTELHLPDAVADLARTGLEMALEGPQSPAMKPNKHTKRVFKRHGCKKVSSLPLDVLEEEVLLWSGKFDDGCYGCDVPCVKTRGIVSGLSPQKFAELLMDSQRVHLYNKMSLGRADLQVFQKGVNTTDGPFGCGETKVVRNRTKPPLTSKKMEFVTLMHARPLTDEDGGGLFGGYIVVSRAVGGKQALVDAAMHKDEGTTRGMVRSEILLGVNLLRCVKGDPDSTDVTSVTHVNSPAVPAMMAGKVGAKGAIDFINDIRALSRRRQVEVVGMVR